MRQTRRLHDGWVVSAVPGQGTVPAALAGRDFPATVPGCVHTDLLDAGVIADPYLDRNELDVDWIGRTAWCYQRTFEWSPDGSDRQELVFDGLDTVATVSVNGRVLGRSVNMHRSYRYDVTDVVREGANSIGVTFDAALPYAEAMRDELGSLPHVNAAPFNFIRKMACSFGWDWGLSTITAGIWRPVSLESWSGARFDRVRPTVSVELSGHEASSGRVRIEADLVRGTAATGSLTVSARVTGPGDTDVRGTTLVPATAGAGTVQLAVEAPQLWWPHTHGAQPLYQLTVEMHDGSGSLLDSWTRRIGFRDVHWDFAPDEHGTPFTLVVNDRPIFVRGVNWIPDDAFPTRVDCARYRERLEQARAANVDLVRVWGGGLYESDDFYDECDALGLLVWQDFLFACAAYPEEAALAAEVEAEAREAVARLMPHPSLVLWNGNNENIWAWFDWGWQQPVGDRTWGKGYYLDLLPQVVAEVDPARTYWPGSPYSGSFDVHPNDPAHGLMHIWDVWNTRDYPAYRDYVPRFVSEFGWQAPPAWATLTRAVHDVPLAADSPGVLHHQKAADGNGKLARGLAPHFPLPVGVDDWHYLTQVNQGRALTLGIEHFRSHRGRCMGTVWWQLNDCWPVTSWAVVDGDARLKPAYFALRRAYADRLLTLQPRPAGLTAVLVNDTATEWVTTVALVRLDVSGKLLADQNELVRCPAFGTVDVVVATAVATPGDPAAEFVSASADQRRTTWWFAPDRELALRPAEFDVRVQQRAGGYDVRVSSNTVVRDLCLFADRLDPGAVVDDALLAVLPGESVLFRVDCARDLHESALVSPPVLRCVNDLVAPW